MPVGNLGLVKPCQVSLLLSSWTFPVLFISTTVAMGQMHIVSFLGTVNAFFFKDVFIFLFIFRQRGRKREREGEKHQCVVAFHAPPYWGPGPATQACALTGNQTGDPLVRRLALNPLSQTSQGHKCF